MTKKDLTEKCRKILYDNIEKKLDNDTMEWLWNNVLIYHPNRTYKFEDVISITPKHNWEFGNKNYAFEVETHDGVKEFWSFYKCIKNI